MAKVDLAELRALVENHPGSHPQIDKRTMVALIEAVETLRSLASPPSADALLYKANGYVQDYVRGFERFKKIVRARAETALTPFTEDNE